MSKQPVENVRDQIGFCGIWCGSCVAGNGALLELAKRFEQTAKGYRLEKWAPKDFDFNEFMRGLASIQKMPSCKGCRQGGGNQKCTIRMCAVEKNVNDFSQCSQLMQCSNFAGIEREKSGRKEGLLKIKNRKREELIAEWTNEIKTKWPHCLVFCASSKK